MKQKGFALPIILLLVGIVVLGYFGYQYFKPMIRFDNQPTNPSTTPGPTASINPTPTSSQSVTSKLYQIKFALKSDSNPPPTRDYPDSKYTLAEYMEILLKLPSKSISNVLYDTRNGSPYGIDNAVFKRPYDIILNQPTKLSNSYTDQYATATTQVVNDSLLPYLIKNDYCERDTDCTIRASMCTVGAYNYYQNYADPPWGCGPGSYKGIYSWFEYGMYDEQLKCNLDSLEFDGARCENHVCTETGYKKVCAL